MERRLSAVFAADMVGYSRLMEADEVGTLERQKTHRRELVDPALEEFHGRIIKEMGDGLLVEFPSVVEAVQCAVVIQRAMPEREAGVPDERRITYRVGINLGDIIVEGDDIHGDGVNVAARLEAMAEPGGICISGTAFDHLRSTVAVGYESLGEVQVKNIERPIRAYRVLTETADAGTVIEKPRRRMGPRGWAAMAAVLLLVIGAGVWWSQQPDFEPADPEKYAFALPETPSIAVLPFDNLSGDPAYDYLGDSLTENIIAELATVPELLVIARNSVMTYKGKPVKVQQVAEELGVKYVLEGSVQAQGDRLRVVAQLVDALDGKHLWAERYDYQIADIFEIQDNITEKIAMEMEVKLTLGDLARQYRADFEDPDDYRKMVEARVAFQKWNAQAHAVAERLVKELLQAHPDNPSVNRFMAYVHWQKTRLPGKEPDRRNPAHLEMARKFTDKAMELSGDNPDYNLLTLAATLDLSERKHEHAVVNIERALQLAPSSADVHSIGGSIIGFSGKPEEGVQLLRKAMRMEPSYPSHVPADLCYLLTMLGRYDEAAEVANGVLAYDGDTGLKLIARGVLTAIAVFQGDMELARQRLGPIVDSIPDANAQWGKAARLNEKNQDFVDKYYAALVAAGLPEYPPLKLPDNPSIAVLPFDNLSSDREQDYFANSITEYLIIELSRFSEFFVIARNSSFVYRSEAVPVQTVAKDLGVRYVLQGSVRKSSDNLRISVQLVDAISGTHVWAERYDRSLDNLFAIQDEIIESIAGALGGPGGRIEMEERARAMRKSSPDLTAYDYYLRGREAFARFTEEGFAEARRMYRKAIELDPDFVSPYVGLAWIEILALKWGRTDDPEKTLEEAQDFAKKAASLDSDHYGCHWVLGVVYMWKREHIQSIAEYERALELSPSNANLHAEMADALTYVGRVAESIELAKKAIRLNPNYPDWYLWNLAAGQFLSARYEDALATLNKMRNPADAHRLLAATYAQLGRIEEARAEAAKFMAINPNFSIVRWAATQPYQDPEYFASYVEGLRMAGLPE